MSIPFDAHSLRSTLGSFVTGVTIVTTRGPDGAPVGVTANSFNSVSLDPPMVLWSLAKSARCRAAFSAGRTWAVHVLSAAQQGLSARFASPIADKFEGLELEEGVGGLPLLNGCVARLQCKTAAEYGGGDHVILVGEVIAFDRTDAMPLLFHGGGYALAVRKNHDRVPDGAEPGFFADFARNFLGYLLGRAHLGFYSQMGDHASRYGLDEAAFLALLSLRLRDGQSLSVMNEILRPLGRQVSTETVAYLLSRGLLQTKEMPIGHVCSLTSAGRELTSRVAAELKSLEADALSALTAGEAALLKQCLRALIAATPAAGANTASESGPARGRN